MSVLETVLNSRKFDLNDYFNLFSLDEEDIWALRNFVEQIRHMDIDSTIYVCTYGYEIMNNKGEKSTYADTLWIDTVLPVSKIEELIEKNGVAEPSDTSCVKDSDEIGNGSIWIATQEEQNPKVIERTDHKQMNHMIMLYWD